jgi:sulfonate transport system ATP-binding protein
LSSDNYHPVAPLGRPAVQLHNLRRIFNGRAVLDGIDLEIGASEFVALLGKSGSGKTTILRLLAGLDRADEGTVRVAKARSVVFQEPRLVLAKKVWQNVVIGHDNIDDAREAAIRALTEVGLDRHAEAWPRTLSGGEAQRVALARALAVAPDLLLLDEPFASLDALTRLRMHELVGELWKRHRPAVVLVTHDVDEAIALADRILMLSDGKISMNVDVDLPHPRARVGARFADLRQHLLDQLGVTRVAESLPVE